MRQIDQRFSEFTAASVAGQQPDRELALAGLKGADRYELADLIDGFLAQSEGELESRYADPADFAKAQANDPLLQRIGRSVAGVSGIWPALLPRLRERLEINRDELGERLAAELGNPGGSEKVDKYYHRMEWGDLPAAGVSQRVLEALAVILDTDAEDLRESGLAGAGTERFDNLQTGIRNSPGTEQSSDFSGERIKAFARLSIGEQPPGDELIQREESSPEAWDETDRLFLGG
ncbi:MAG: hypothetical protein WCL20_00760 [Actinomycetes bacterium]